MIWQPPNLETAVFCIHIPLKLFMSICATFDILHLAQLVYCLRYVCSPAQLLHVVSPTNVKIACMHAWLGLPCIACGLELRLIVPVQTVHALIGQINLYVGAALPPLTKSDRRC